MIVEPVPTGPRSPIRRLAGVVGLTLPLIALVVVAGGAALGRPAVTPAPSGAAPVFDDATPRPDFPPFLDALPVRSVAGALEERHEGRLHGLVAVSGYLSVLALPAECADRYLGPLDGRCDRRAVLADSPEPPFAAGTGGFGAARIGPHLHPQVPWVVRLPGEVAESPSDAPARPVPVVVVGRFDDPRATPCVPGGRHCGDEFVLERVGWVTGERSRRTTVVDPALAQDVFDDAWRVRQAVAQSALGRTRLLLASAYVTPASLARLDPVAAARLDAAVRRAPSAVWYLRGLDAEDGPPGAREAAAGPAIRWVVVDDGTGQVLASGEEPTLPDHARG